MYQIKVKNDALLHARAQTELSTSTNVIKFQRNATEKMSAVGNTEEERVDKCNWWFRSYRNR